MTEVASGESDGSSSSSSSASPLFLSFPSIDIVLQQQQTPNPTTTTTKQEPPQQQWRQSLQLLVPSANATPNKTVTPNTSATATGGPRRPRHLNNRQMSLDIAPRELQSFKSVSVVKLSDNLVVDGSSKQLESSVISSCGSSASSTASSRFADQSPSSSMTSTPASLSSGQSSNVPSPQASTSPMFLPVVVDDEQQQSCSSSPPASGFSLRRPVGGSSSSSSSCSTSDKFTAAQITDQIFVGGAMDAMDAGELIARGIFFILNCAVECDFSDSVANNALIRKKHLDLRDNVSENITRAFDEAISFIEEAVSSGSKILVHCFMGVSRSPSIVLAYMMKTLAEQDLSESLAQIARTSVIEQHQKQEERDAASSPTMLDELRNAAGAAGVGDSVVPPPALASSCDAANVIVDCMSLSPPSISNTPQKNHHQQQQQQQRVKLSPATSSASSTSSTGSSRSYYKTSLSMVQKARPEVLPNFAFSCALQEMDDRLMLRCTA